jgi:Flp pilus assembly protein TadG
MALDSTITTQLRIIRGKFSGNLNGFWHKISRCGGHIGKIPMGTPRTETTTMLLARFFKDCKAGVAPLLALGIIPLVGSVGAAVDYGRASSVRTAMQAAGDATALMLAKTANALNNTQLQSNASAYFLANFDRPDAKDVQVVATYSSGAQGFNVTVTGSAKVNTNFMGMMGFTQIPLSTTASVTTPSCGSHSCSTTPPRWRRPIRPAPARLARSRPRPTIYSHS